MTISISSLILVVVLTTTVFLGFLNLSFWQIRRQDNAPLWLAAWLITAAVFALCRLLQYTALSEQMYVLVPRFLLTASYSLIWWGYGLGNAFIGYQPPRRERVFFVSFVIVSIIFLWISDLILTKEIVIRRVQFGEEYTGVTAGPFYMPASILILMLGAVPAIRLYIQRGSQKWESRLMAMGYLLVIFFSLNDFLAVFLNLNWIRLADYSYLPVPILFSYIQLQRFGRLYEKMDIVIRDRTEELSHANETLRASEERYRELIDAARDVIFTLSPDGLITSLNPSFEIYTGWWRDEWLGHSFHELIAEEDRPRALGQFETILQGQPLRAIRLQVPSRAGNLLVVEVNMSPQLKDGKVIGLLGIARDMTQEHRAENALRESEEKYRTVVENAHDGITIIQQGVVKYANLRLAEMRGEEVTDILGQRFDVFIHPDERGKILERYRRRLAGEKEPAIYDTVLVRKDNSKVFVELTTGSITYQSAPAEIVIIRDSTERKQAEEEIHRHVDRMTALYETTRDLVIERDLSKLLQLIVERATQLLNASSGGLYLCEPELGQLRCVVSYNTLRDYTGTVLKYGEGAAGRVAQTGEPLLVDDYSSWEGRAQIYENQKPFRALISAPMKWQNEVIGVLNILEYSKSHAFIQEDQILVVSFANQAAIAVQNARLYGEIQQRNRALSALQEATLPLMDQLKLSEVLQSIITQAARLLDTSHGYIYLVEDDEKSIRVVKGLGIFSNYLDQRLRPSEGLAGKVWQTALPQNVQDYHGWAGRSGYFEDVEFHAVVGVPLISGPRVVGVLGLAHLERERVFSDEDVKLLNRFAQLASIAFENAQLFTLNQQELAERKITQGALIESRARLAGIIESAMDGIITIDSEHNILLFNAAAEKIFGCSADEVLGQGIDRFIPPRFRNMHREHIHRFGETGVTSRTMGNLNHLTALRANGEEFPVEVSISQIEINHQKLYTVIVRDVTARKQAEEELRLNEQRLRQIIDLVPHFIFAKDLDGKFILVNQAVADAYGTVVENLLGKADADFAKSDDEVRNFRADDLEVIHSGKPKHIPEEPITDANGYTRILTTTKIPFTFSGTTVPAVLGVSVDITDRKQAEETLRQAEKKFRTLVEQLPIVVYANAANDISSTIYVSPQIKDFLGYTAEEWLEDPNFWSKVLHEADRQRVLDDVARADHTGEPFDSDYRMITRSGNVIWIRDQASLLRGSDGHPLMWQGLMSDITESKLAEETLRRQLQELNVLNAIAAAEAEASDIDRLIEQVTEIIGKALFQDNCGVLLVDEMKAAWRPHPSYRGANAENIALAHPLTEGIVGKVVADRQAIRVGDIRHERMYLDATPGIQSEVCVPILVGESVFGALNAESKELNGFSPQDERLLITIANTLATAVQRIQLLEMERHRQQEATAIAEVGRDVLATLQLDVVLERIATYAKELLNAETSAVFLVNSETETLRAVAAFGIDAKAIRKDSLRIGEGILGNIARQQSGEIVYDTATDPRAITIEGTEVTPLEHLMGVPILSKDQLTGLMAVWCTGEGKEFRPAQLEFLHSLAAQAAVAIENARLYEETQQRLREMEAINKANTVISQTLELEPMLENVLQATIHAIPAATRGSILLVNEQGSLSIRAVWGYTDPRVRAYSFTADSGYAPRSFREKHAIIIPDVHADATIRYEGDIQEMLMGGSAIAAPLIVKDKAIGVIAIDTPLQTNAFNQRDLFLLETMSSSAALAIENARLFEAIRQRLADLETLQTIASALRSAATLEEAVPIILDQFISVMNVRGALLEILDPDTQEIVTQLARGIWSPMTGLRTSRDAGISGHVISTGKPYITDHLAANGLVARPDLVGGLNFAVCVPIIAQHHSIGALWVGRETPIKEEEVILLTALGEMVGNTVHRMRLHDDLRNAHLKLAQAYDSTLEGWAKALELRDRETEGHTRRVTELTVRLAGYMGISGEEELLNIRRGALLHDIGKMGVPDYILKKTGKLTDEEWIFMRRHPQHAYDMLSPIGYLKGALDIPYCHHEHWDGSGYPRGLRGEQIPLVARVFSIVDIWDALLSDRSYRKAWPKNRVINYLQENAGKILDPEITRAFLEMLEKTHM